MQGYRTIMCGPAQPSGELFWPIPGLGTAYIETQVMQVGEFVRAIVSGGSRDTDFAHGWRMQEIMEAMLAAAKSGRWMPVPCRRRSGEGGQNGGKDLGRKLGFRDRRLREESDPVRHRAEAAVEGRL